MMNNCWWKEPDLGVPAGEVEWCAAARMWRSACGTLCAPDSDEAWQQLVETSPPDSLWHSLRNCVAYQAGIWQNLLSKGITDVVQPAAFKLAIVLRHTPTDLSARLLSDMLNLHPQSQDLTSYVLALLTDDEAAWCGHCGSGESPSALAAAIERAVSEGREPPPLPPPAPAPPRDLQLFGDCELAIMAASREEYDAHAKLVRAEYSTLSQEHYVQLRIKVLKQFSRIPKLYHTPEFECFEAAARENIDREICTLREHLLSEQGASSYLPSASDDTEHETDTNDNEDDNENDNDNDHDNEHDNDHNNEHNNDHDHHHDNEHDNVHVNDHDNEHDNDHHNDHGNDHDNEHDKEHDNDHDNDHGNDHENDIEKDNVHDNDK